ncbi:Flp family type IVb pilin [Sphingomonadaceae bacterium jetA1]|jgi:pilus assembly protein Flp/PilA|uniref:Flp family type IVb pilin n=1 Tax=Facivitalis istanbulensis TaxID=3075838 RepID=UPI003496118B
MKTIRKMIKDNKGATAIEYGLIAALVAVAAIVGMGSLGKSLNSAFSNISSTLDGQVAKTKPQ